MAKITFLFLFFVFFIALCSCGCIQQETPDWTLLEGTYPGAPGDSGCDGTLSWANPNYKYRTVACVQNITTGNYQINFSLHVGVGANNESDIFMNNHNETSNYSDIQVYNQTGVELSYWIEDNSSDPTTLWINATENGSVQIYYGYELAVSASDIINTFEFGTNFKPVYAGLGIHADNAPGSKLPNNNFFAENIEYDSVTEKFWWVFSDRSTSPHSIRLASASTINGTYTAESSSVISESGHNLDAPCIKKFGSYWYIYYCRADDTNVVDCDTYVQKSTTVNSGYSATGISNPIVSRGSPGTWEDRRASECYVYKNGSTYYMFYMGDRDPPNWEEHVGYATSSSPDSGFVKYGSNPVISGGTLSEWDGRPLAADPFVFEREGVVYVGYTGEGYGGACNWVIGLTTTSDFINFVKYDHNPVLKRGDVGTWDSTHAFRGAVTEHNGTFYLSYTGHGTGADDELGLTELGWDVPLYVDPVKWAVIAAGWNIESEEYVKSGTQAHAESKQTISVSNNLRIDSKLKHDDTTSLTELIMNTSTSGYMATYGYQGVMGIYEAMGQMAQQTYTADMNWHDVSLWRRGTEIGVQIDSNILLYVDSTPQSITSVGVKSGGCAKGRVDDFRVRRYLNIAPSVSTNAEEERSTTPAISNIQNGSISATSQYIDWDVNQTANNVVIYDTGATGATSTACAGQWSAAHACLNASDGNWSTYAQSAGAMLAYAYFNHIVPAGASQLESLYHVKDTDGHANLTIPAACWGATLYLRATGNGIGNSITWQCDNGAGWTTLRSSIANIAYEEEMSFKYKSTWDNSTAAPNITLSSLTANTEYYFRARSHNVTNDTLSVNSSIYDFTTAGMQYNISGFILNATGIGLSGATVSGNNSLGATVSGLDGNYSLGNATNGAYHISATLAGYTSNHTIVTIAGADETNKNITLVATSGGVETFVNPVWVLASGAFVLAAGWLAKRWGNRRRKRQ